MTVGSPFARSVGAALVAVALLGPTLTRPSAQAAPLASACPATRPDALGPFYVPDAPVRARVGTGHVLLGTVRAAGTCAPIPGARVEFWLAGPDGRYGDAFRATVVANASGRYRFESHTPPAYGGRPPHIHLRVSAEGFQTLVTQYYPPGGRNEAVFDLVLLPAR